MAAAREGTAIDFDALVEWSRTQMEPELADLYAGISRSGQTQQGSVAALHDRSEDGHDNEITHRNRLTLIEGVGGAMVPLNDTHTVRDWIAALGIPVILVTGSYLGSISHTLTAIEALRVTNIPIRALIISETADSTVPLAETLQTILPFTGDIPLHIAQARVSSPADATEIHALLKQLILY